MARRLLKYGFWETADKYYAKLFERVLSPNLLNIRKYIAKTLLCKFEYSKPIVWLDVGSGDGATLSAVFDAEPNFKKRKIKLIVIEPSVKAIKILKPKLKKYKNLSLKIIDKKFNLFLLKKEKYDIISFLHSSYYITNSKKDFEKVYLKAYDSLKKDGVLLVQSIKSDGDFRKLETPPRSYNIFACGDKTFEIFKKL